MIGVLAPDLGNDGVVSGGDLEAFEGVLATLVGSVRRNVCKLREKQIWASGFTNDLTKYDVGDAFHGR